MEISERYIIDKLIDNDESGLRLLFDKYYIPLCVYAIKYIDSYSEAEDLVQEIFIKFWEEKKANNLTSSLKAYLFAAIRNNALNLIRKNKKFQIVELNENIDLEEEVFNSEAFELKKQKLYAEIEQLPPQSKNIFTAIIFENKKYKEVAKTLGISVNTVKTHFSRALKHLRSSIDIIVIML